MLRFLILLFMMISVAGKSQELNCRVIINSERIQITERSIFDEMQQAFTDFLNNQKWTENEFQDKERINCNLIINLDPEQSDPASGRYGASVQILSSRPVYGSDYESVLLNFADRDWVFEYLPSQPMQFNPNSFLNNITSLLAYYAYVILAFDYDSFSDLGGDPYVQKAWQVVNNAQQSGYSGWEQFNSIRNRYWLAENLLNAQMQPIRKAYYEYHRTGLDLFQEKPDEARTSIFESIKKVQNANASRPRAILTISFLDAKASELAQIFSDGNPSQRRNAYNMLTNIDPTKNDVLKPMIE